MILSFFYDGMHSFKETPLLDNIFLFLLLVIGFSSALIKYRRPQYFKQ